MNTSQDPDPPSDLSHFFEWEMSAKQVVCFIAIMALIFAVGWAIT